MAKGTQGKKQLEVTSQVTKRPYLKIMEKIRSKIAVMLKTKIGDEFSGAIVSALRDKQIDQSIKNLMKAEKIQLHNEQNKPVYKRQISQLVEDDPVQSNADGKGTLQKRMIKKISIEITDEQKANAFVPEVEEEGISPELRSKTHIAMKEQDLKHIENKVKEHIRKHSKKLVQI